MVAKPGALFPQRKVHVKEGQSVRGVQEFRRFQGTAAAQREGWLVKGGGLKVAVMLPLKENRGDEREDNTSQQPRVAERGPELMAILAQGNLI